MGLVPNISSWHQDFPPPQPNYTCILAPVGGARPVGVAWGYSKKTNNLAKRLMTLKTHRTSDVAASRLPLYPSAVQSYCLKSDHVITSRSLPPPLSLSFSPSLFLTMTLNRSTSMSLVLNASLIVLLGCRGWVAQNKLPPPPPSYYSYY